MSRREAWLSATLVLVVAALVRAYVAAQIVFPKPEDTAYYVGVARNLVEGRGLITDALWSYASEPLRVPRDAFEVWLPLPSLVAALPMWLLRGDDHMSLVSAFRAAQITSIAFGAIVAVLAWRLGADVADERGLSPGRARTLALGAGLTAAVYLPLLLHSALPDSTMPFAAAALGACLVMSRTLRAASEGRASLPGTAGIGLLLGMAALTRNEAIWLALVWALLVIRTSAPRHVKVSLVGVVAVVSLAVFAPWAVRNWVAFGSPVPGQALSNSLSVTGHDIFAWNDAPTLARYLAVGPGRLLAMRAEGVWHNAWSVLLSLGMPISLIGLVSLPWQGRDRALRPLVLTAIATFLVTSLVFPVSTTWGTYLHAAGPTHVLLMVVGLAALDALIARVGAWRGWHRPVAWLGPALAISASSLLSVATLPVFAGGSEITARQYEALATLLPEAGVDRDPARPVIHDFPIWLAEANGWTSIVLPEEAPEDVVDLARHFGAEWLLITGRDELWPGVLDQIGPGTECYQRVPLPASQADLAAASLAEARLYRITCSAVAGSP